MIRAVSVRRLNAAYRGLAADEFFLELAQEHFLDWLRHEGLTEGLVFKGGTSLRKFVFGLAGRFSRDLDFTVSDRAIGELVIDALSAGFRHEGVTFHGLEIDRESMKAAWQAETTDLGRGRLACRLDFSTRSLMLPPVARPRSALPGVSAADLGFSPLLVPLADLRETMAEKLARLRRVLFARDVYDVGHLIPLVRADTPLVRELLIYKVYFDVVDDGRGGAPFRLGVEYRGHRRAEIRGVDELGSTTQPVFDYPATLRLIEDTYGGLSLSADEREQVLVRCGPGDRYRALQWVNEFREGHTSPARGGMGLG